MMLLSRCVHLLGVFFILRFTFVRNYVNASFSEKIWHKKQVGLINQCVVSETGVVPGKLSLVVSTAQGTIAALSVENGDVLWRQIADQGLFVENLNLLSCSKSSFVLGSLRKYSNPSYERELTHLGLNSLNVLNLHDGRSYLSENGHVKFSEMNEQIKSVFAILHREDIQKDEHGIHVSTYNDDDRLLDVVIYPKGSLFEGWVVLLTKTFVKIIDLSSFNSFYSKLDLEYLRGVATPFRLLLDAPSKHQNDSNQLQFTVVLLSSNHTVNGLLRMTFDIKEGLISASVLYSHLGDIPPNLQLRQYKKHNDSLFFLYKDNNAKSKYLVALYWCDPFTAEVAHSSLFPLEVNGSLYMDIYNNFSSPICFIYSNVIEEKSGNNFKTTLLYKDNAGLRQMLLDGHWVFVGNNIPQHEGKPHKHFIAKKQKDSVVMYSLNIEENVLSKYKTLVLKGSHHPQTELLVMNAYWDKNNSSEVLAIGCNDGIFQLYMNDALKWERDESLAMTASSISLPSHNFVEIIEALSKSQQQLKKKEKKIRKKRSKNKRQFEEDDTFESVSGEHMAVSVILDQVKQVAQIYLISYDSLVTFTKFTRAITRYISKAFKYFFSFKLLLRSPPALGNCPIEVIGKVSKRDSKFARIILNTVPNVCHADLKHVNSGDLYNTYDHGLYYKRVKKIISNNGNQNEINTAIVIVLSSLNKLTAISERTGRVLWTRLLTNTVGPFFLKATDDRVYTCNHNGRRNRFNNTVNLSMQDHHASLSGCYYTIGSRDICEIFQVSKTVICVACKNVGLQGKTWTELKWINAFDGSEFYVQRMENVHSHLLPLWWNLTAGHSRSFNLDDAVIVIDANKNVDIYYPEAVSEHHKLVGRRRYEDTMFKVRRTHFVNCKLTAIFNNKPDCFQGYAIKNNEQFYLTKIGKELYLEKKWSINFRRSGLTVVALATPEHMDAYIRPMIVLRNLSVYEKFITSNIMVFITKRIDEYDRQLKMIPRTMLHLVNTETGNILFEEALDREATHPFRILFNENTIDVHYWHAKQLRYVFHTVDLFVNRAFTFVDFGLNHFLPLKFNPELIDEQYKFHDLPMVNTRDYVLPFGVRAFGATSTKHGITPCLLIFATSSNMVVLLPRNRISSTTPFYKDMVVDTSQKAPYHYYNVLVNRHEQSPYHPMVDLITVGKEHILDPDTQVLGVRGIVSSPMNLESTSLVFLYGLDLALYHVQPSGQYDAVQGNILYYIVNGIIASLCVLLAYSSYRIYAHRHRRSFECSKTI